MFALIEFIVILIAALIFVLSNQQSSCDISLFGLYTFRNEPVYVISLVSFTLGIIVSIPFFLFFIFKKKSKGGTEIKRRKKDEVEEPTTAPQSQD
ncbi:MAG: hypothetical protein LBG05_01375 [Treponema sp.]|jgi:uncharacterized integral membrane protein|nr:hypothetical protein [Treponema sp.]